MSCGSASEDITTLGEPICVEHEGVKKPVICIAGEATSRKHIGTTAGAYFSGVREAERLISSLNVTSK